MKKLINFLLVLLMISGLFSCSSSKTPENESDILPDADADTQDSETVDDDSDSKESEITDDSDEYIEPVYPNPVCIYIYPGQEDSKLCFGPKKTNVKCKANPKENEYVTVLESDGGTEAYENPLGNVDEPMDLNNDFVFFVLNPKDKKLCFEDKSYCPNIYGCNRKDEYVYEIAVSKYSLVYFSVYDKFIVFNLQDSSKENSKNLKLFLGDLKTNKISELSTGWGAYGKVQMFYPYVVFLNFGNPLILNLESNTVTKISDLRCSDSPKIYNEYIVCRGQYLDDGLFTDELDSTGWMVDLKTFDIRPLSVFMHEGVKLDVSKDFTVFGTGRDGVYYANYPGKLSGMEIYSFNLKTKREEKWTPEIKGIFEGNFTMPSFEYPYFSYVGNDNEETRTGSSYILNIETREVTKLYPNIGQEWPYIKDRHLLLGGYVRNGIAKLPDLPKLPENADELCEDDNPCTDNRYFVTDGECHFIPNHERCDDDDDTTLFDVCVDGECRGFAGTSTDEEMVLVEAGKFMYDGKEYEIEKPFKMDVFEVTNGKYAQCVAAKACVEPLRKRSLTVLNYYGNPFYENFPVLYINQFEAQNYCNWLGKRLPTEFEWMKATWDGKEKTYLWGEERPDSETYPESYYANSAAGYPEMTDWDVVEVGTFPKDKTIGGIMDMSGNVSEWTVSEWTKNLCDTPPCKGKFKNELIVTKGGELWVGPELAARYPWTPWTHSFRVGFRCVKDIAEDN